MRPQGTHRATSLNTRQHEATTTSEYPSALTHHPTQMSSSCCVTSVSALRHRTSTTLAYPSALRHRPTPTASSRHTPTPCTSRNTPILGGVRALCPMTHATLSTLALAGAIPCQCQIAHRQNQPLRDASKMGSLSYCLFGLKEIIFVPNVVVNSSDYIGQ